MAEEKTTREDFSLPIGGKVAANSTVTAKVSGESAQPDFTQDLPLDEEQETQTLSDEDELETTPAPSGPRFGMMESFFLILFNALGDVLELLDLTILGTLVGMFVDFINGPGTVLYLYIKGVPRSIGKNTIAQAAELIPFIDVLPIRTTVIVFTIVSTNHPEWLDKLGKLGELIKKADKIMGKVKK